MLMDLESDGMGLSKGDERRSSGGLGVGRGFLGA